MNSETTPNPETPTNAARITRAGFVAIIGKPNVGKSTLLNTMLGIKVAPISPKPQTTRKGVRGIYTWEDQQLVFVDTPGLHRPKDALGNFMNREVRNATMDVEGVLWIVDLRHPPGDEDKDVARLLKGLEPGTPVYLIGNKSDVAKYPDEAIALYKDLYPEAERVYTLSALNDPEAVYALREDLFKLLPESPFFFPENIRSDQSREQWAAELIRESVMIMLREELPYTVAVQVSEWREAKNKDPLYISADIWVEKSNHRMIVLGKGGKMIKEIGQYARKQLEVFLQQKLFLDLHVEVHSNWRQDVESLRELGYEN
jgi:GTPase